MDKKPQPQPQSNRPNKPMPAKKNDIKDQYRVNERIRAKEVRLVGDNVEQGYIPYKKLYIWLMNKVLT